MSGVARKLLEEQLSDQGVPERAIPVVIKGVAEWLDSLFGNEAISKEVREFPVGEFQTTLAPYWSKMTLQGLGEMLRQ